jgi:hypothetical protein
MLGITGVFIGLIVQHAISRRAQEYEKSVRKNELLQRAAEINEIVQSARSLIAAAWSPKTWTEQSRRLIELRPKVDDLLEDVAFFGIGSRMQHVFRRNSKRSENIFQMDV